MIVDKLKEAFRAAEPITLEFAGLMRSTFAYYTELQSQFRDKLPDHLHQSELNALLNGELRPKLFNHAFCDRIQDTLKTLRRAIIRLEDLRRARPDVPAQVNDLETLARLAEAMEGLYQRHWEHYRYQSEFTERDLVGFLAEVDRVGYEWDVYLEGFTAAQKLIETLSGRPLPEHAAAIRIAYEHPGAAHLAVESLNGLTDFLRACYAFVCAVTDLDAAEAPLSLLQVEVGEPVELRVALPQAAEEPYRRFLQYLFLKDMLQRDALLKFVMEAIQKEYREGPALPPAAVQSHQKQIGARLKALPADGRFHIADRAFPRDGVPVMREFIVSLEQQAIPHDALLGGDKARRPSRVRKTAAKPAAQPAARPAEPAAEPGGQPSERGERPAQGEGRTHISILTGEEIPLERNPDT